jgi:hypothetical protein
MDGFEPTDQEGTDLCQWACKASLQNASAGSTPALKLSCREAFALLDMCLVSPLGADPKAESALLKLAAYAIRLTSTGGDSARSDERESGDSGNDGQLR